MEVGDLPGRKCQPNQAGSDLFRHYGSGQAGGKRCPEGVVEQTLYLIASDMFRPPPAELVQFTAGLRGFGLRGNSSLLPRKTDDTVDRRRRNGERAAKRLRCRARRSF